MLPELDLKTRNSNDEPKTIGCESPSVIIVGSGFQPHDTRAGTGHLSPLMTSLLLVDSIEKRRRVICHYSFSMEWRDIMRDTT